MGAQRAQKELGPKVDAVRSSGVNKKTQAMLKYQERLSGRLERELNRKRSRRDDVHAELSSLKASINALRRENVALDEDFEKKQGQLQSLKHRLALALERANQVLEEQDMLVERREEMSAVAKVDATRFEDLRNALVDEIDSIYHGLQTVSEMHMEPEELVSPEAFAGTLDVKQEASIRREVRELGEDVAYLQHEIKAMEVDIAAVRAAFAHVTDATGTDSIQEALDQFHGTSDTNYQLAKRLGDVRSELRQQLLTLESLQLTAAAEAQARAEATATAHAEVLLLQRVLLRLRRDREAEDASAAVTQAAIRSAASMVSGMFATTGAKRTIFDEALHHIVLCRRAQRPVTSTLDTPVEGDEEAAFAVSPAPLSEREEGSSRSDEEGGGEDVGFFLTALEAPTPPEQEDSDGETSAPAQPKASTALPSGAMSGPRIPTASSPRSHAAATSIQARWRGHSVRSKATGSESLTDMPALAVKHAAAASEAKAATIVQASWRGHVDRKHVAALKASSAGDAPGSYERLGARVVEGGGESKHDKARPQEPEDADTRPGVETAEEDVDVVELLMRAESPQPRQRRVSMSTPLPTRPTSREGEGGGTKGSALVNRTISHDGVQLTGEDMETARQYAKTQLDSLLKSGVTPDTVGTYLGLIELRLGCLIDALAQGLGVQAPRTYEQLVAAGKGTSPDGPESGVSRASLPGSQAQASHMPQSRMPVGQLSQGVLASGLSSGTPKAAEEALKSANMAVLGLAKATRQEAGSPSTLPGGVRQGVGAELLAWMAQKKAAAYTGKAGRAARKAEEAAERDKGTPAADARLRGQTAQQSGSSGAELARVTAGAVTPYFAGYEELASSGPDAGDWAQHSKPGVLFHSPLVDSRPLAGSDPRVVSTGSDSMARAFNVVPPEMPQMSGQRQRDAHYLLRLSQLAGMPLTPRALRKALESATGGVVVGGVRGVRAAALGNARDHFATGKSSQAHDVGRTLSVAGIALEEDEEDMGGLPPLSGATSSARKPAKRSAKAQNGASRGSMLQTLPAGGFSVSSALESGMDIGTSLRALLLTPARSAEQVDSSGQKPPIAQASSPTTDLEASFFSLPEASAPAQPDPGLGTATMHPTVPFQKEGAAYEPPMTADAILAEFQALRQLHAQGPRMPTADEGDRMSAFAEAHSVRGGTVADGTAGRPVSAAGRLAAAHLRSADRLRTPDHTPSLPRVKASTSPEEEGGGHVRRRASDADSPRVDAASLLVPSATPASRSAAKLTPLGTARARLQASTLAVPAALRQRAATQAFLAPVSEGSARALPSRSHSRQGSASRPASSSGGSTRRSGRLGASESAPLLSGGRRRGSTRGSTSRRRAWEAAPKTSLEDTPLDAVAAAALGLPAPTKRPAQAHSPSGAEDAPAPQDTVGFNQTDAEEEAQPAFGGLTHPPLPDRGLRHVPKELAGTSRVRPTSAAHRIRSVVDPSGHHAKAVHARWLGEEAAEAAHAPVEDDAPSPVSGSMTPARVSDLLASTSTRGDAFAMGSTAVRKGGPSGVMATPKPRGARTKSLVESRPTPQRPAEQQRRSSAPERATTPQAGSGTRTPLPTHLEVGEEEDGASGSPSQATSPEAAPLDAGSAGTESKSEGKAEGRSKAPKRKAQSKPPHRLPTAAWGTPGASGRGSGKRKPKPRVSSPKPLKVETPPRSASSRPWASPPATWSKLHAEMKGGGVPIRIAGVPGLGEVTLSGSKPASNRQAKQPGSSSPGAATPATTPAFAPGASPGHRGLSGSHGKDGVGKLGQTHEPLSPLANADYPASFAELLSDVAAMYEREGGVGVHVVAGDLDPETLRQREAERKAAMAEAARQAAMEATVSESTKRAVSRWKDVGIAVAQRRKSTAGVSGRAKPAEDGGAAGGWEGLLGLARQRAADQRAAESEGKATAGEASGAGDGSAGGGTQPHPGPATPTRRKRGKLSTPGSKRKEKGQKAGKEQSKQPGASTTPPTAGEASTPALGSSVRRESRVGGGSPDRADVPRATSPIVERALAKTQRQTVKLPGSHTRVKRTKRGSAGSPYKTITQASIAERPTSSTVRLDPLSSSQRFSRGKSGAALSPDRDFRHLAEDERGAGPTHAANPASSAKSPERPSVTPKRRQRKAPTKSALPAASPLLASLAGGGGSRVAAEGGRRRLRPMPKRPGAEAAPAQRSDRAPRGAVGDEVEVSSTGAVGTGMTAASVRFADQTSGAPSHAATRAGTRQKQTTTPERANRQGSPTGAASVSSVGAQPGTVWAHQ